ncbi:MAG: hypothetical protein ABIF11_11070 [Nitrospirota bacterium]
MKKTLSCLISGMMILVTSAVFAGINYPDINVTGQVSLRATDVANLDDFKDNAGDNINAIESRLRLFLSSDLADNVKLSAMLQKNKKTYGEDADTLLSVQNEVAIKHANIAINGIADKVDLVVGQMEYGKKFNSLVYYALSIDGILAKMACGQVDVTLVDAKISTGNKDNLQILGLSGKIGEVALTGTLYNQDPEKGNNNRVTALSAVGNVPGVKGLSYSVEYAMQEDHVKNYKTDAEAMLIKVGYGMETDMGKLNFGLVSMDASGDKVSTTDKDEKYTGVVPSLKLTPIASDKMANNAYNDDFAYDTNLSNKKGMVLNASLAMNENLTMGIAYGKYKLNEGTEKNLGSEIALSANYKQADNIGLDLVIAQFDPKKGMSVNTDKATKIQAGMKIEF